MSASDHAFGHVNDQPFFEIWPSKGFQIDLPNLLFGRPFTKYMLLELVAAGLLFWIYTRLARNVEGGKPANGPIWNLFEGLLTFVRDQIAKPYIGEKDADTFVPYLWSLFLFILINNIFGLIPFLGSPTADFGITLSLAFCTFVLLHAAPVYHYAQDYLHGRTGGHGHDDHGHASHGHEQAHSAHGHDAHGHEAAKPTLFNAYIYGVFTYLKSYLPHADMSGPILIIGYPVLFLVAGIEIFGTVIKSFVLALRLFANMYAGHCVMAFILMFIDMAKDTSFAWPVSIATVLGLTALSFLELFVAFLQAYVFTFLTALFLGSALHPEH